MNLTLGEIVSLHIELNGNGKIEGLLKTAKSQKLKIVLHRIARMTAEEFKQFEEQRLELYKELGKIENEQVIVEPIKIPELEKRLSDLLDTPKEVDVKPFWGELNVQELIENEEGEYCPTLYKLIGI